VVVDDAAPHHCRLAVDGKKGTMMSLTSENITRNAVSMFDMMLEMQRIGLRAMTAYQPGVMNFLAPPISSRPAGFGAARAKGTEFRDVNQEHVIAVGEEVLNVGTRMVQGKTTTVRRVVVEATVQQDVTLHTETVVLERRRPISASGGDVLTEVTVEMSDFNEVPVVSKSVHLVEEVLLRKEITARTETIHETVKRDKLEIDQPSQLPVVFGGGNKKGDKPPMEAAPDGKQSVESPPAEVKAPETKRR
jgi:stress response protein YsnF